MQTQIYAFVHIFATHIAIPCLRISRFAILRRQAAIRFPNDDLKDSNSKYENDKPYFCHQNDYFGSKITKKLFIDYPPTPNLSKKWSSNVAFTHFYP